MLAAISWILNAVLAGAFISTKSGDIDQYHETLAALKNQIKAIELDAKSYWGHGSNSEMDRLSVQINTEIHHLIRESQSLSKRYSRFKYQEISRPLLAFKQAITGGAYETASRQADNARIEEIGNKAIALCSQIDSFYIPNKFIASLPFWKRV